MAVKLTILSGSERSIITIPNHSKVHVGVRLKRFSFHSSLTFFLFIIVRTVTYLLSSGLQTHLILGNLRKFTEQRADIIQ